MKEEPHNVDAINGLAFSLQRIGEASEALQIVEEEIGNKKCTFKNDILFFRAMYLAEAVGDMAKKEEYEKLCQKFGKEAVPQGDNFHFNEYGEMFQKPVVKAEKVYPNDPCPCGSGKKYKKCCRR